MGPPMVYGPPTTTGRPKGPNGRVGHVSWFFSPDSSSDRIDRQAEDCRAVKSVITVGAGSDACTCDICEPEASGKL
jgi:hypothetical protein